MKLLKNLLAATVAFVLTSAVSVFAEKTPIDDLYQYKLDNGLSLFVAENHSVLVVVFIFNFLRRALLKN